MNKPFKVAIIGAGAAGIFTAAAIKKNIPNVEVEIVFDPKLKHIGVGESLGFSARSFFREVLGLTNEKDWLDQSQSTRKFGIRFLGWDNTSTPSFWGPGASQSLGFTGPNSTESLEEIWLDLYKRGLRTADDFQYDFPFARFCTNNMSLDRIKYTYHINAEYIKDIVHSKVGLPSGVKERPVPVREVVVNDTGVDHLILEDGTTVHADLFIDSTGFGKLIVKKLPFEFEPADESFNDTAIVGPYRYQDDNERNRVFTDHVCMDWGWRFSVPLTERTGEGYISNSRIFSNHDQLISEWEKSAGKKGVIGRVLKWEPGYLKDVFVKNCIVIGLGHGMIEPYDANVFTTSLKVIRELVDLLKADTEYNLNWKAEFNTRTTSYVNDVKLRISTAMHLSPRKGEYWDIMREVGRKNNTLEKLTETIFYSPPEFGIWNKPIGQHSYLEMLHYYGYNLETVKTRELVLNPFKEKKALEVFKSINNYQRQLDLSECHRLIPRRSSMDRTILS